MSLPATYSLALCTAYLESLCSMHPIWEISQHGQQSDPCCALSLVEDALAKDVLSCTISSRTLVQRL